MYTATPDNRPRGPVNVHTLHRMKREGEKIAALTAYDYTFAALEDAAGVDVMLVGDSLGMVVQGRDSTLPVTVEEIVYHCRCVAAGRHRALIMADMPFMSHGTLEQGLANAGLLMKQGGAHMVKVEGAADQARLIAAMASAGVPVCAHLGLRPQSVHKLGGYRVQGKDEKSAKIMIDDAVVLEEAGADMLLLECVPAALAERISTHARIPVIGIGAGSGCDGQILVVQDMLGITQGKTPKFAHDFMPGQDSVASAVEAYVVAVKSGGFPAAEHCF